MPLREEGDGPHDVAGAHAENERRAPDRLVLALRREEVGCDTGGDDDYEADYEGEAVCHYGLVCVVVRRMWWEVEWRVVVDGYFGGKGLSRGVDC